jgi:hypothetical protein
MNHLKMSISILLLLTAIGCATSYQPSGFGGGYSDTQLAPDVFRVVFRGNGHTDAERVQDFALLRASELTLQHGYVCFVLINEGSNVTPININTPGYAETTGSGSISGNRVTYSENTTYYPGQTYTFYKHETGLLIKAFTSKPENISTFDAEFLQQSIRQKYQTK